MKHETAVQRWLVFRAKIRTITPLQVWQWSLYDHDIWSWSGSPAACKRVLTLTSWGLLIAASLISRKISRSTGLFTASKRRDLAMKTLLIRSHVVFFSSTNYKHQNVFKSTIRCLCTKNLQKLYPQVSFYIVCGSVWLVLINSTDRHTHTLYLTGWVSLEQFVHTELERRRWRFRTGREGEKMLNHLKDTLGKFTNSWWDHRHTLLLSRALSVFFAPCSISRPPPCRTPLDKDFALASTTLSLFNSALLKTNQKRLACLIFFFNNVTPCTHRSKNFTAQVNILWNMDRSGHILRFTSYHILFVFWISTHLEQCLDLRL